MWQTNVASNSIVRYELNAGCGAPWTYTITSTTQVTSHSPAISGLSPSTAYCYQVESSNGTTTATSVINTFVTLSSEFRAYLPTIRK
jgi:hypothetical protein